MFLRLLFRKHNKKENKWIMAFFYALMYMAFTLIVATCIGLYQGRLNIERNLLVSSFVFAAFYALYIFKWELFYSKMK